MNALESDLSKRTGQLKRLVRSHKNQICQFDGVDVASCLVVWSQR